MGGRSASPATSPAMKNICRIHYSICVSNTHMHLYTILHVYLYIIVSVYVQSVIHIIFCKYMCWNTHKQKAKEGGGEDQGTRGPGDKRTRGPGNQRTRGPEDQGTRGPEDQGTRGPEDQRTRGPILIFFSSFLKYFFERLKYFVRENVNFFSRGIPKISKISWSSAWYFGDTSNLKLTSLGGASTLKKTKNHQTAASSATEWHNVSLPQLTHGDVLQGH